MAICRISSFSSRARGPVALLGLVVLLASCGREGPPRGAHETGAGAGPGRGLDSGETATEQRLAAAVQIVVAWAGSEGHRPDVTRTREEAEERASRIWALARRPGADFAELASRYSDDPQAKQTGGYVGIFRRGDMVLAFEEAVFRLEVDQIAPLVETEFGFHIIKRVPVRRIHTHHILIAWAGAGRAGPNVIRTKGQALALAQEVRRKADLAGADLCKLTRQYSDDVESSTACGELGIITPGQLPLQVEEAVMRLRVKEISEIVETEFGYHIFWREP